MLSAIDDRVNGSDIALKGVVDGIRKTLGQQAMKNGKLNGMYPGIKHERVDIGVYGIKKILANAGGLLFVETVTLNKVEFGIVKKCELSRNALPYFSFCRLPIRKSNFP